MGTSDNNDQPAGIQTKHKGEFRVDLALAGYLILILDLDVKKENNTCSIPAQKIIFSEIIKTNKLKSKWMNK